MPSIRIGAALPALVLALVVVVATFSSRAGATVLNLSPAVDGVVNDADGNGVFDSVSGSGTSLSVRFFPGTVIDRSMLEIPTSSIPNGATINSVTLQFYETSLTSGSTTVNITGYAGNGSLSIADAVLSGISLGSYDPVAADLGPESVALNVANFNTVRSVSSIVGVRLESAGGQVNTQMASTEGAFGSFTPPVLVVDYTPEPGSAAMLMLLGGGCMMRRRARTRRQ